MSASYYKGQEFKKIEGMTLPCFYEIDARK
jgi:hypothetical protein